jgi:prepilin peptidase CpaA
MSFLMLPTFLFVLSMFDYFTRKVPNSFILVMALIGLMTALLPNSEISLLFALLGFLLGLVFFLPSYLMGTMGAADVKVFAVTGLYLGPFDIFSAFIYTLISGGVLALIYWVYAKVNGLRIAGWRLFHSQNNESQCSHRETSHQVTLPYVVAIFMGVLITNLTTKLHH